jgi:hypothetical protein
MSLQRSIAWESLSGRSATRTHASYASFVTTSKSADVLRQVCRELDMPPSFLEHALHFLLGIERPKTEGKDTIVKPPPPKSMVSFMARAFKRCTQDYKLVVVALDDIHHADELSWKVLREIFETSQNVLVIGTSYPTTTCKLKADPDFWAALDQEHRQSGRFASIELGCLNKEEVAIMIMKTLGLQRNEVNEDLLHGVTIQSGGMPHFVNEILEYMKRQMVVDPDFEIDDVSKDKQILFRLGKKESLTDVSRFDSDTDGV